MPTQAVSSLSGIPRLRDALGVQFDRIESVLLEPSVYLIDSIKKDVAMAGRYDLKDVILK